MIGRGCRRCGYRDTHFDNEIDMAGLAKIPGAIKTEIKPQLHRKTFCVSVREVRTSS
jgi:hypothetical protein